MIFAVIFAIVPMLTVMERKLLGRFQARYGPNRVGPLGLLQPLADAVKLITKEHYRPARRDPAPVATIAPSIVVFTGVATLAIIPFGNVQDGVGLYGIDVPIGILYFFAFGSIAFYGLLLGGWASGSKYSFLGRDARRGAADLLRGLDGPGAARRDHDGRARCRWSRSSRPRTRSGTSSRSSSAS